MLNNRYFSNVELRPMDMSHSNQLGQFSNWAFMNEAERWDNSISTRTAHINHAIKELKKYDGDVNLIWRDVFSANDVDPASLTHNEQVYINAQLNK